MKKYLEIIRVNLAAFFVWRLDFVIWRIRQVIEILIIFFLWNGLYGSRSMLFGYTKAQMMTYLLLAFFASSVVQATETQEITGLLISGEIINLILRPLSIFKYYMVKDLADKLLNFVFVLFEIVILVMIFRPPLYFPSDPLTIFAFVFFIFVGTAISFYINMILSFTGFWSTETWAPRFIFYVLTAYLSGIYFPLDVLPKPIYYVLLATPLPYMQFLPARIFIKGINETIFFEIIMSFVWLFVLHRLAHYIWNRGLRTYSFFGR